MTDIKQDIRENFYLFLIMAFGNKLRLDPHVRYLCTIYQNLGEGSRVVLNQPPRTLKSWMAKCYVAWRMGRDPSEKTIFLSATLDLAQDIVYDVRKIMQQAWFSRVFPETVIAHDRRGLKRLRTTAGGSFFAGSMDTTLGGVGATIILIDDGNRIGDCNNPDALAYVNAKFDTEIASRLNPESGRKKKGIILCVQHRIAENDLSGHLVEAHGFKRVAFPLIATRRRVYRLSESEKWTRELGDVLLNSYSKKDIRAAMQSRNPPAYYFYQQARGRREQKPIDERAFQLLERRTARGTFVVSIDPAQRETSSFNVIQVWNVSGKPYHLRTQFRQRCGFATLEEAASKLILKYQPGAILVENTANGTALISRLQNRFPVAQIIAVEPHESKGERLDRHRKAIRHGIITLEATEDWTDDYILEFACFPNFGDDQVDTTTQTLDFLARNPRLIEMRGPRALVSGIYASTGRPILPDISPPTAQAPGMVVRTSRSIKFRF